METSKTDTHLAKSPRKLRAVEAMNGQIDSYPVAEALVNAIMHPALPYLDVLPDAKKDREKLVAAASQVIGQLVADEAVRLEDLKELYLKGGNDE